MISNLSIASKIYQFVGLCLILTCGGFLFYVSLEARHAEEKLARTQLEIQQERQQIAVLKAEITHLSHPDRLEKLAQKRNYHVASAQDFIDSKALESRDETLIVAQGNSSLHFLPPLPAKHPTRVALKAYKSQKDRFQTVLNLFSR